MAPSRRLARPPASIRGSRRPGAGGTGITDGTPAGPKHVGAVIGDLWSLTVSYAKQEIRDPLKGLGSYLAYGIATMLLMGAGGVLLALGGLRALQTQTGSTFTGNLSWLPYVIVVAASVLVIGAVGAWVTRDGDAARPARADDSPGRTR